MKQFLFKIRRLIITGIIAILPLYLTILIFIFFLTKINGFIAPVLNTFFNFANLRKPPELLSSFLGIILALIVFALIGLFTTNYLGRKFMQIGEDFLKRIPFIKSIYFAIKQIIDTFSAQGKSTFSQAVLIEYPRKGIYSIGFITGKNVHKVINSLPENLVNVLIPSTPNPTTGWLVVVPESEIIKTNLNAEVALKYIISGGLVSSPQADELINKIKEGGGSI